jgi:large subunit ribosomal protein L23
MTVIRGPHLSEKSHIAAENNQIVFKVRHDATKSEIRQAVELLFEVEGSRSTTLRSSTSRARRSASERRAASALIGRRPT